MEDSLDMRLRDLLPIWQERIVERTSYFGVRALQNPLDFWVYQEIFHETKPDVIIEIGTRYGGTTLALAHLCDLAGRGRVVSVDLAHDDVADVVRDHPRVTLIEGAAVEAFPRVEALLRPSDACLVIEDSSHTFENTLEVLRCYAPLVAPGGIFIVEDGICHHGLALGPSPGPYEAIEAFVSENRAFEIDRGRESFLVTWNPKGYLKRVQG